MDDHGEITDNVGDVSTAPVEVQTTVAVVEVTDHEKPTVGATDKPNAGDTIVEEGEPVSCSGCNFQRSA
ncbi:hypothetical protein PINS_up023213 [Pythium insidiosum]|nr:hypothetical protein PINS_up023213 [Pythium insidiosum]